MNIPDAYISNFNRFHYLNGKINMNWLNMTYEIYKLNCKRLFLNWNHWDPKLKRVWLWETIVTKFLLKMLINSIKMQKHITMLISKQEFIFLNCIILYFEIINIWIRIWTWTCQLNLTILFNIFVFFFRLTRSDEMVEIRVPYFVYDDFLKTFFLVRTKYTFLQVK